MRAAILIVLGSGLTLLAQQLVTAISHPATAPSIAENPAPAAIARDGSQSGDAECVTYQRMRRLDGIAPVPQAGATLGPGSEVLGRWSDGNWWRGTATTLCNNDVWVEWADGSGGQLLNAYDTVVPLPPKPDQLEPGDRALCDWKGGTRWWRAQVVGRIGDTLNVLYIDGTSGAVPIGKCVAAE